MTYFIFGLPLITCAKQTTNLSLMKKVLTKPIMFTLLTFLCVSVQAQQRIVSGTVTDETGEPMPGVSVLVKNTGTGMITDIDGNYKVNLGPTNKILIYSFIGYQTTEIPVNNRSVVDHQMILDITQLSEVVVTAFGNEQEKRSLGYAVEEVTAEELTKTKETSVISALQGKVSGVQITNSGGAPGMSSRIVIRGLTSLNPSADNQPLFVVDGVPIDNSTTESTGTPRGMSNRAADINPNDVESVSILKGAAATALYGVRAANGAVIITTKKGKAGKIRVNVKSTVGFQEINKFPDFQEEYGQGFSGEYQPTSFWPSWGAPISAVQAFEPSHQYYDNSRNTMQTGTLFDNYVSASGGSENATFFVSIADLAQKGVIPNSDWGRTSAKLNGTIKASSTFDASASVLFSNSGGNRVPHDRVFERLMYWANTQDVTDYINPDGTQNTYGNTNPIYDSEFETYVDDVNRTIGNINLNYRPLDWLNVQYRIGVDYFSDQRTEISPGPVGIPGEAVLNGSQGRIAETRISSRDFNSTLNITLSKDITDDLSATLRVGNDIFDRNRNTVIAAGSEFVIPQFFQLGNTTNPSQGQNIQQQRLIGVYGDLTLNYKDFLYLNVTGRNDWTSTLNPDNRSFFYPSVSTGFIFNDVLNLPSEVSFAKLRASYAEVGKDALPYSTSTTYSTTDPINGQLGFTRNSVLGTPDLKPERTTSIEFGIESGFIQNRFGFDLTYYQTNSRDQIIPVPVSNATGFTRLITNAGEIENKGIELLLRANPVRTDKFSWDFTLNFTRNRNKVVDIREGIESIQVGSQFGYAGSSVIVRLIEGDAYGNIYGTSYSRYYPEGVPEDLTTLDADLPLVIGADGFPERNGELLILGNSQPNWLAGLTNTVSYSGLSLSFLIDVRQGVDQFSQFDNFYSAFGKLDYSLDRNKVVVFDGVLEDGSPNEQQVWLGQGVGPDLNNYGAGFYRNDFRGVSENFVTDASFVKLRNITLAYELPNTLLDKSPLEAASISVAANNIILFTPWRGYDPESFSSGAGGNATALTGLGFPGVRSLLFTLNLTL